MLRYQLTHPALIGALAGAGHGSRILLADSNYPLSTASRVNAERIYLNLRPGQIPVTDVLATVIEAAPIEAAHIMDPDDGTEPDVFSEFRTLLDHLELQPLSRQEFYQAARGVDVAVAVASGDQRLYANILLTIGVVTPKSRAPDMVR